MSHSSDPSDVDAGSGGASPVMSLQARAAHDDVFEQPSSFNARPHGYDANDLCCLPVHKRFPVTVYYWREQLLLILSVALVGLMYGLSKLLIPMIGHVVYRKDSSEILLFIVAFGAAKALISPVIGLASDEQGRTNLLRFGWLLGIPVFPLVMTATSWTQVILANVLLGLQQGTCWSLTIFMMVDLSAPANKATMIGLNEFVSLFLVALITLLSSMQRGGAVTTQSFLNDTTPMFWIGIAGSIAGFAISCFLPETRGADHGPIMVRHAALFARELEHEDAQLDAASDSETSGHSGSDAPGVHNSRRRGAGNRGGRRGGAAPLPDADADTTEASATEDFDDDDAYNLDLADEEDEDDDDARSLASPVDVANAQWGDGVDSDAEAGMSLLRSRRGGDSRGSGGVVDGGRGSRMWRRGDGALVLRHSIVRQKLARAYDWPDEGLAGSHAHSGENNDENNNADDGGNGNNGSSSSISAGPGSPLASNSSSSSGSGSGASLFKKKQRGLASRVTRDDREAGRLTGVGLHRPAMPPRFLRCGPCGPKGKKGAKRRGRQNNSSDSNNASSSGLRSGSSVDSSSDPNISEGSDINANNYGYDSDDDDDDDDDENGGKTDWFCLPRLLKHTAVHAWLLSFASSHVFAVWFASTCSSFKDGIVWGLSPILFKSYNLRVEQVGLLLAVFFFTRAVLLALLGYVSDRGGSKALIVGGLILEAFSMIYLVAAPHFILIDAPPHRAMPLFAIGSVLLGIGQACLAPALHAAMVVQVPSSRHSSALGVLRMWSGLGLCIGAGVGGVVADALGFLWTFVIFSVFLVIAAVLAAIMVVDSPSSHTMAYHALAAKAAVVVAQAMDRQQQGRVRNYREAAVDAMLPPVTSNSYSSSNNSDVVGASVLEMSDASVDHKNKSNNNNNQKAGNNTQAKGNKKGGASGSVSNGGNQEEEDEADAALFDTTGEGQRRKEEAEAKRTAAAAATAAEAEARRARQRQEEEDAEADAQRNPFAPSSDDDDDNNNGGKKHADVLNLPDVRKPY